MPNWCSNVLTVKGNDCNKFYLENRNYDNLEEKEELDFYKSVPMPSDVYDGDIGHQERELYGTNNWYNWNISNLGTKWNVHDSYYEEKNIDKICYSFDTAWSPPLPWVLKISQKYTELSFELEYNEMGMGFGGLIEFKNGNCLKNEEWDPQEKIFEESKNEIKEIVKKNIDSIESFNILELDEDEKSELIDKINEETGYLFGIYISDSQLTDLLDLIKNNNTSNTEMKP